jgi:hypothetical protein
VAAVAEVKAEDAAEETLAEAGHSKALPGIRAHHQRHSRASATYAVLRTIKLGIVQEIRCGLGQTLRSIVYSTIMRMDPIRRLYCLPAVMRMDSWLEVRTIPTRIMTVRLLG